MNALALYGPGDYRVEPEWKDPAPVPGWARVRVAYAGIYGSDLARFGKTGSYHHPMVLGHEFAGRVETPAPGSTRFRVGEPVAAVPIIPCKRCPGCQVGPFHCEHYQFLGSRNDGGFAEYCLVPEDNLVRLPTGLDLRFGAFIEPLAVALHAVRRAGFVPGASAFVFGAGTIGLLIGLWLKFLAAGRVAVADVRDESLQVAHRVGLSETVNAARADVSGLGPFDFVFEAAGAQQALVSAIEVTQRKGTLTVVGRDTKDTVVPLRTFERLMRKELSLVGCWGYDIRGDEERLRQMLGDGRFSLAPLITHEVSLAEAPALIRQMLDGALFYCKALIRV